MMDDSQDELAGLELHDDLFNHRTDTSKLRIEPNYRGFDNNCGDSWIYPTNYPVRQYQYDICQTALFRNTLVVLPTGLGKTFIAAVVMYNLYRWYPRGKVIFMAPTRPLVAQQIEACYQIMGISKNDTAELTGKQAKAGREAIWRSKRVFYCTPQVLAIDLQDPDFPAKDIKLIVVDEAHKARGKYAYAEVIRLVGNTNANFRVLALSATPGRSVDDVAEVIRNLLISQIEVRSEKSPDVVPYTHNKRIQTVVVKLDNELAAARCELLDVIEPYLTELTNLNVVSGSLRSVSKGWLVIQKQQFLDACRNKSRHIDYSHIMTNFSACISLYHGLELLEQHGIRIFLNFFEDSEKHYLLRDNKLRHLIDRLRRQIGPNLVLDIDRETTIPIDWDFGHPKYKILRKHLLQHFTGNADSRALVFCEFRESVYLIEKLLGQNRPLLRPNVFVGQGTSNGLKAVTQKQQIAVMKEFREGLVNILIATCVAEEGIDVGEIDLIVCFDISTKNPTRFVQRIGRTGRKRDGCVLMLCTEGKEQRTVKDVLSHKDRANQDITNNQELTKMLLVSPRMVPSEFNPRCIETFIRIDGVVPLSTENGLETVDTNKPKVSSKISTKPKKTFESAGTQDVRKFFKPIKTTAMFDQPRISSSPVYDATIDYPDSSISISTSTPISKLSTVRSQPTPNEARVLQTLKKIRSLKLKVLRAQPANTKTLNINSVIKSSLAPKSLQRYILEANIPYLESQLSSCSLPLQKNSTFCINDLFGGPENLRSFIKIHKSRPKFARSPLKEIQLKNYTHGLTQKFEVLEKEYFSIDILAPVCEKVVIESSQLTQIPQSTQMPRFIETESKYMNLVDSPAPARPEFASSTPLNFRSVKPRKKSPRSDVKHQTPIKKAFQRVIDTNARKSVTNNIAMKSSNSSYTLPPRNITEILRYFRLKNIMDLFVDETASNEDIYNESVDDIFVLSSSSSDSDFEKTPLKNRYIHKTTRFSSSISKNKSDRTLTPIRHIKHVSPLNTAPTDVLKTIPKRGVTHRNARNDPNQSIGNKTAQDISDLFADSFANDEEPAVEIGSSSEVKENINPSPVTVPPPQTSNNVIDANLKPFSIPPAKNTKNLNIYIGSLDDIFLSDDDDATQCQFPILNKEHQDESEDSIPASQTSTLRLDRTLSSKLSAISQKQKLQTVQIVGVQPTRQISADMFEVSTVLNSTSQKVAKSKELSSSIKGINNDDVFPILNIQSPRRTTSPPTDITRSPSLLAPRMSFSRIQSIAKSQRTGGLMSLISKNVHLRKPKASVSSSDDDYFEIHFSKKVPDSQLPSIPSIENIPKSVPKTDKVNTNTLIKSIPLTQDHSPIRTPRSRNDKRFITSNCSEDEEISNNLIGANQKPSNITPANNTKNHNIYIGSLDDIFLSDDDDATQCNFPILNKEHQEDSEDSIPASQTSTPQLGGTIASKLAFISQQKNLKTAQTLGVQPTAHMFEVSAKSNELSSSLKENNNNDDVFQIENIQSPRRSTGPLTDITRSPSLLAPRMSFSRVVSIAKSQRAGGLGRFERRLPLKCKPKAPLSSSDDDFFEIKVNKKLPASRLQSFSSLEEVPKSIPKNEKVNTNTLNKNIPLTRDPSPIRPPRSRAAKRFITSSSSEDESPPKHENHAFKKPSPIKKQSGKRFKPCTFLDQECGVSGTDSECDEDGEDTAVLADLIDDDNETTYETTGVDMEAIYIQSVRSPIHRSAGIAARRPQPDVSYIFSQAVEPDVEDYAGCSFVVTDDESPHIAKETKQVPLNEMCPLERAEFILKQRRRAKRLGIQLFSDEEALSDETSQPVKKKQRNLRRVVISIDSSDEDS